MQSQQYLFPTAEKEAIRINAVSDGTPDERHPVKHDWWLIRGFEQQLVEDVQNDCQDNN